MSDDAAIHSRRELLQQLAVAAELEHGLCLQYLFTAATLKDRFDEGGLTADELNSVRAWKATLGFIASQEMLHLAQVVNLTIAVGGIPHLTRPSFPQRPDYYPTGLPWGLWPFRAEVIELYAWYERPDSWGDRPPDWPEEDPLNAGRFDPLTADAPPEKDPFAHLPPSFDRPTATTHRTIADLYAAIAQAFRDLPDIIVDGTAPQLNPAAFDAPQLVAVTDVPAALAAIDLIVEQGEGRPDDEPDSHLGAYLAILAELDDIVRARPGFRPARDVTANPLSRLHRDNNYPGWRLIHDENTREVNDLVNHVYRTVLELIWLSVNDEPWAGRLSVRLMTGVLAPLAETVTALPMGDDGSPGERGRPRRAGPSFELDGWQPPQAGPGAMIFTREALLERATLGIRAGDPEQRHRRHHPERRRHRAHRSGVGPHLSDERTHRPPRPPATGPSTGSRWATKSHDLQKS